MKKLFLAAVFALLTASSVYAENPMLIIAGGENISFSGNIAYPAKGTSDAFEAACPEALELTDSNCIVSITNKSETPIVAGIIKDNKIIKTARATKGGTLIIKLSPTDRATGLFRSATWGQSVAEVKKGEVLAIGGDDSAETEEGHGIGELQYVGWGIGFNNAAISYTFFRQQTRVSIIQYSIPRRNHK